MYRSSSKLFLTAFASLSLFSFSLAQWTPTAKSAAASNTVAQQLLDYSAFQLNVEQLKQELANAPMENPGMGPFGYEIRLPMPGGHTERFRIVNSPIVSGQAASQLRGFATYSGQGVDDPQATVRLDLGSNGFHAMILSPNGDVMVDPVSLTNISTYISFYKRDFMTPSGFRCLTDAPPKKLGIVFFPVVLTTLKTYRLAMNANVEYTNFHGGVAPATTAVGTAVNRVTGVYEKDFGIRLNMTYVKCWSGVDPYTNSRGDFMLGENQTETDATVGNANYDIGHVFSTGGGGIAGLRVVGVTGQKAWGVTGLPSPTGDPFYIDYVAHEMGHQFGGNHTFNNCPGGSSPASARYEPGSASTIMGYAGICGAQNVQNFSDAYFHTHNYDEIIAWRNNAGSGGSSQNTANNAPTVNAGADFTIPTNTPFKLTGTGADPDNDPLTYCWEEFDLGAVGNDATQPLFRSRNPGTSRIRFMPQLSTVINNGSDIWERLPPVNRSMTFRCTVRDNRVNGGGSAYDAMVVTVSGAAFSVSAPNTAVTWNGGTTQTVTWNVGGGAAASPNVNILLSTDGGNSYGAGTATMLLANTPNDGSQQITVPSVNSTQCRIIVEAASSIYYDMSNTNFTIVPGNIDVAPNSLTVREGLLVSGNVPELATSDDLRVVLQRWKTPVSGPHIQAVVEGISSRLTTSQIVLRVEAHASSAGSEQTIEAFNFSTGLWVLLDTQPTPTADTVRTLTISTNPSQFIQPGTGKLSVRVGFREVLNMPRWFARIDQVRWTISP
jgi:hypothetical protein